MEEPRGYAGTRAIRRGSTTCRELHASSGRPGRLISCNISTVKRFLMLVAALAPKSFPACQARPIVSRPSPSQPVPISPTASAVSSPLLLCLPLHPTTHAKQLSLSLSLPHCNHIRHHSQAIPNSLSIIRQRQSVVQCKSPPVPLRAFHPIESFVPTSAPSRPIRRGRARPKSRKSITNSPFLYSKQPLQSFYFC